MRVFHLIDDPGALCPLDDTQRALLVVAMTHGDDNGNDTHTHMLFETIRTAKKIL